MICDAINEMSSSSASGPDGLPAILFKECRDELSIPLQILFAKSFSENHIAQGLKSAAIVPVYKGGGASIPSNYRPISLTSIMMKILERVIRKQIIAFMTKRCVFNPSQHGFREGRSCLSALLTVYDNIMLTLNSSSSIDMIYLDFAKAFDKVDHNILLHKVKAIGIQGKLGIWIKNFLSNRTQHVRLPGGKSHCSSVISGVPQGTVLGPVLFLILMSDISKDINCNIISFADDTRLYSAINSPADCDSLQCDLSNVYKWAESNNMKFNSKKFQYINFTVSPQCNTSNVTNVYVSTDSNLIDPSHTVKDLGVLMSNDCMFDNHICQVTKKCSQLCGWILRTFENRSELLMLTLFKSIVLSRIDYASQLWSPYKKSYICALEKIQRSFTKYIAGYQNLPYSERLKSLRLYSLQRRRDRYLVIYMWKIAEGLAPNLSPAIRFYNTERRGRLCYQELVPNNHLGTLCHNSFRWKASRLFNSLPANIRNIAKCEPSTLKHLLDRYLQTITDLPCVPNDDNSLDARIHEMRWCTPRGGLAN